jgi:pyrroline-5-carboxylate reductase
MISLPKTVGTIGGGNMAEAILQGLIQAGYEAGQLRASDPVAERREHLTRTLGVRTTDSNLEVVEASEVVVLAVKPQQLEAVLEPLPHEAGPLYLSIAAGIPLVTLQRWLGGSARVVRAMPNTPALIGAGISAIASDSGASDDLERAEVVLGAVGDVVRVPEHLLDAVTGLSGSGPAYVYLFIEALCEAGIREGLPSPVARDLAVQTVLGAASMVRETGDHPALLRERVTSPGGTTAAGLAALEREGLRAALLAAVEAATERSRELARDA